MAVAVIDRDGTIQFVNKRWTDFSVANGYRGTAFVGANYSQGPIRAIFEGM